MTKTHIHLNVRDALQSVKFYEALLRAAPARPSTLTATFDLDSPPLVLVVEQKPQKSHAARGRLAHARFTLIVNHPRHVGEAAIALRTVGVHLLLEDRGIAAQDPDENAWRVRFVATAPYCTVLAD